MKYLRPSLPAISIFCLALFVRILYNILVAYGYNPVFDAGIYNKLARSLVEIHCYCRPDHQPTTFRPPLWPFIIAMIYTVAGEHSSYIRVFASLLDAGTCVFVYLLARDLFGKSTAYVTGIAASLYTGLFIWTGWLYTETLYTFCLTALILSLTRIQRYSSRTAPPDKHIFLHLSSSQWWVITGGLFLGLAMLTRPNGLVLIGLLCVWVLLLIARKMTAWRKISKNVLALICIAAAINLPWLYRDYLVTHTLIPVSTVGTTLVGNYNDIIFHGGKNVIRGTWLSKGNINPDYQTYTQADEQKDTEQALTWMRTHISEMPTLLMLHVVNMWTPSLYAHGLPFEEYPDRFSSLIIQCLIPIMSIPVFLLAAGGLIVSWQRKKEQLLIVYLVITFTILQNLVFYGLPRFRAPIEPLLILLAGAALWWWKEQDFRSKRRAQALQSSRVAEKALITQ